MIISLTWVLVFFYLVQDRLVLKCGFLCLLSDSKPKFVTMPDGRIRCLACDKFFSSFQVAKTHQKELHSKQTEKFTCDLCSRQFSVKRYLVNHYKRNHNLTANQRAQTFFLNSFPSELSL